ncbi:hypothetical protein RSOLAG22IIIB_04782 [Rhizoctonia solani]|uniref:Uncharacterized protein n=1 Tax=Rhizoctonia solani TaxID=456999 RepID=A0A0K6G0H3_9AGAM|nr:hypothetical protein RSOLAG22IIIB_04782 [Rhizoctonia solani]
MFQDCSVWNVDSPARVACADSVGDSFPTEDSFTWDLSGTVIAPEIFAQCLCDDYQTSSNSVVQAFAKSITE